MIRILEDIVAAIRAICITFLSVYTTILSLEEQMKTSTIALDVMKFRKTPSAELLALAKYEQAQYPLGFSKQGFYQWAVSVGELTADQIPRSYKTEEHHGPYIHVF